MLKTILIGIFLVSMITSSSSLNCFSCMTSREGNCEDGSQMETKICDSSDSNNLNVKPVCLKVVKDIKGFDHITRSCQFEGDLYKPCNYIKAAEHCSTCDSNLCNSAKTFSVHQSLYSSLFLIVLTKVINL
ncbi:CLUMA_CG017614, isoform A [Clunio marinus]|uniref:CLUMA_CG017614, isoform A n=1 Tax=Clunio marinus TaxID=568069 RepID=A0A1J1IWF0_9DIPT|nr:CLUMA_CG017614, isoform A [Clunio marinus]